MADDSKCFESIITSTCLSIRSGKSYFYKEIISHNNEESYLLVNDKIVPKIMGRDIIAYNADNVVDLANTFFSMKCQVSDVNKLTLIILDLMPNRGMPGSELINLCEEIYKRELKTKIFTIN